MQTTGVVPSIQTSDVLGFAAQGPCHCSAIRTPSRPNRIVVTGGPGAGKTATLALASRTFCAHVGIVPEAASMVFGGGFPRLPTDAACKAAQLAIFHVQHQLESLAETEGDFNWVLCDRGTIDGVAYWPGPGDTYWSSCATSQRAELDRYAAVVHLQTPPLERGYNHENHLRTESAGEAARIDARIEEAWRAHPHRIVIASEDDFPSKASRAIAAISELVSRGALVA